MVIFQSLSTHGGHIEITNSWTKITIVKNGCMVKRKCSTPGKILQVRGSLYPFNMKRKYTVGILCGEVSDYFGIFPDGNYLFSLSQPNTSTGLGIQMSLYM